MTYAEKMNRQIMSILITFTLIVSSFAAMNEYRKNEIMKLNDSIEKVQAKNFDIIMTTKRVILACQDLESSLIDIYLSLSKDIEYCNDINKIDNIVNTSTELTQTCSEYYDTNTLQKRIYRIDNLKNICELYL